MTHLLILMLVVAAGWCSAVGAVEVKYWDRLLLAVPLTLGQERILMLDKDVRVGPPSATAGTGTHGGLRDEGYWLTG